MHLSLALFLLPALAALAAQEVGEDGAPEPPQSPADAVAVRVADEVTNEGTGTSNGDDPVETTSPADAVAANVVSQESDGLDNDNNDPTNAGETTPHVDGPSNRTSNGASRKGDGRVDGMAFVGLAISAVAAVAL